MAINEEYLSRIMYYFSVMFTYKEHYFSLQLTDEDPPSFIIVEVEEGKAPAQEDLIHGTLEPSLLAAAKIGWDGELPSDPLVREAMDVIVAYMVERKILPLGQLH